MPAYKILQQEIQEDISKLELELEKELAECTEVRQTCRNKVKAFMIEQKIWHISELDYPLREAFHRFLKVQLNLVNYCFYEKAFDRIKKYSLRNQLREINGSKIKLAYGNQLLFLLYHPDPKLANRFEKSRNKADLVWDFRVKAPEKMKRQIFQILFYLVETIQSDKHLRRQMNALRLFYEYCIMKKIKDIELLELIQIQEFQSTLEPYKDVQRKVGIVDVARKALFLQAEEITWKAHVWYLERIFFQPERIDETIPVRSLSFLEVTNQRNRELLKQYMRYCLGITNLAINSLQLEFRKVRNFLVDLDQVNVCEVGKEQMDTYFLTLQEKEILAESYNKIVMSILHFFNFLQVRRYIVKAPFNVDFYMKKVIQKHHDRSVELKNTREILFKLHHFPEEIRLMYLHLWGVGLRISEVCTLKGDAYYIQGRDAWIQVYQIKMKNYKRIPIPGALYRLMKIYLERHEIGSNDYVFQNRQGGAYYYSTFRDKMLICCEENKIQNGEYLFRSHDYRHSIATLFYDKGVSLQGVRDYLGHAYEEMTLQYIDYMPRKLAGANDEYFGRHKSLAANLIKGKRGKNGKQNLSKGSALLPDSFPSAEKESGKESLL